MPEEQPPQPGADEIAAPTNILSNIFMQSLSTALNPEEVAEEMNLNPSLCKLCQSITFEKLLLGFKLHENYGELLTRAFTCPLCRVLLSLLVNQPSDNWWSDEEAQLTDEVYAKLVRVARQLNKFPERLQITVLRPQEEIERILKEDKYDGSPEIRLVKHGIVCVDPSQPASNGSY